MIVAEPQDLNIPTIIRGGAMNGVEQENPQEQMQPQVRLEMQKK